jgi:hypothetical protein
MMLESLAEYTFQEAGAEQGRLVGTFVFEHNLRRSVAAQP